MTVETLTKDTEATIRYFEQKLAFEVGPVELGGMIQKKEPVQVIDLRMPEYYEKGHVAGAANVKIEELEQYASKLNKDKPTVVYCYNITCHLAAKAALMLAKKGYRVRELAGGFNEYAMSKQPVEGKAEAQSCSSHGHEHKGSCG